MAELTRGEALLQRHRLLAAAGVTREKAEAGRCRRRRDLVAGATGLVALSRADRRAPGGGATLYVTDRIAYLADGTTAPAFRGCGLHARCWGGAFAMQVPLASTSCSAAPSPWAPAIATRSAPACACISCGRNGWRLERRPPLERQSADDVTALQLCKSHRVDRRQRVGDAGPAVALVLAHPQPAGRRAEREPLAGAIERQCVTVDDVVGV
jgi:hypothetical protein